MFTNYFKSIGTPISSELAEELRNMRNKYDYPKSYLFKSHNASLVKISSNYWASQYVGVTNEKSDISVDNYHRNLLKSDSPEDVLLGTSSVIFWGYQTFNKKIDVEPRYALNKVRWHLQGHYDKPATSPILIHQVLQKIKISKSPGDGLAQLSCISQLGQTPFASKVIAFLYPETTGVYDSQIMNGLNRSQWAEVAGLQCQTGNVSSIKVQKGYTKWCNFLTKISSELNHGINNGKEWFWVDPIEGIQNWRAVDVERAIFHYFKNKLDFQSI